ncbi:ASCH domain-containing protein [Flavobacterium cerinum]|uniref:ASCH domain-containing protein n=1 Tax=Flavobacterium cerinum TaxID=2502784 RepID=A0A444HAS6_9FLAO|nr:ASCH domain-containing protein [Flavobacterium cerinum]RWX00431.1 ASCH domain-containing protein [Flavobacterium cerinum]
MLFKEKHLQGIRSGEISLAFRKWKKSAVNPGSLIKTSIGLVEIKAVSGVTISNITLDDAISAGFSSLDELLQLLNKIADGIIYKISISYFDEDPSIALRENITPEEITLQEITTKLERLDRYSKQGDWTLEILKLIHQYPTLRAADLAQRTKWEKEWLKLNIRKLKNIGLTISHEVGYSISPLGEKYLEWLSR